jgi:hypothetical protein
MATEKQDTVKALTAEVTSFIEQAAPVLDKTAKLDTALESKLPGLMDRLVALQIVPSNMKQAQLAKFREDPSLLCDLMTKVAGRLAAPTKMGGSGDISAPAVETMSADEKFVHNVLGAVRRA